ncbi:MAG TPA: hypothetical protein VJB99_03820 [Patescibacteria group bacterium]|nr:hypothetical protein [Patescibacteria group bacterium]
MQNRIGYLKRALVGTLVGILLGSVATVLLIRDGNFFAALLMGAAVLLQLVAVGYYWKGLKQLGGRN